MDILRERIFTEGKVVDGNVLQVGSFLNHFVDTFLLHEIGKKFSSIFSEYSPTKIITIEASGISVAAFTALELQIPYIIAKKNSSSNLTGDLYSADVFSFTKQKMFTIHVSKEYIKKYDKILIIDDFLGSGNAVEGLMSIINKANATLIGVGICIEKSFLHGASNLIAKGINLHSLVKIKSVEDGSITLMS